jgi:hypothetical protein
MADAVIGLIIVCVLMVSIGLHIVHQSRAQRKLAEVRRELRSLETALLQMQATGVQARNVDMEKLSDKAPAGQAWVRISKKSETGQVRSLIGLVPLKELQTPATAPQRGGAQ